LVFRFCREGKIEKVISDRKFFLTSAEFFDQFVRTKMESDNFLVKLCISCFEESQFKYKISISYLIMWINLMYN
jgi:hypothetical protein